MKAPSKVKTFYTLFLQAVRGEEHEYTAGSIDRAIVLLSIPMILEMAMESLFAVVDIYFVSSLNNADATAALGYTESMMTILYSVAIGLSMSATAMVARRIGEKDKKAASVAAVQALYMAFGLALLVCVLGVVYYKDLLRIMGATPQVIEAGSGYTFWMFAGNFTITFLFLINAVFRGAGDAALAMRALTISNGLNIILDPIMIFGLGPIPSMGVEGAAIATNIGRGCGVAYQIYCLVRGRSMVTLDLHHLAPDLSIIWKLVKVSAGSIAQFIIASSSWIFLMRLMAEFGSAAVAGYTIAIRVIIFTILPSWGLSNAAATLVGQNLGAGQPDRAETSVWRASRYNAWFMVFVMVVFLTAAGPILGFFTSDEVVLANGILCLQYVSLGYIFYGYEMVMVQAFNGAGDTKTPTVLNFFGFWLFQIPLAYLLAIALGAGPKGIYLAIAIAESFIAIAAILLFRKGRWKTVKI
jgi:putative MATE family efflux protein